MMIMATQQEIVIYLKAQGDNETIAKIKRIEQSMKQLERSMLQGKASIQTYASGMGVLEKKMTTVSSAARVIVDSQNEAKQAIINQQKAMQKLQSTIKRVQNLMMQFGLNMLFAGIMIKTTFQKVAKTTIDTFMKINAGASPAGTAIIGMGAAFEFLKYSVGEAIGQALLPFLPLVMSIIENIADWVQQNQSLVAGLILGGIALGTFLFLFGQFVLMMSPVLGVLSEIIAILGTSGLTAALAGLGPIMWALIAIIIVFAAMWITNFNGIQEFVKKFIDSVFALFDSLFKDVEQIIAGFMEIIDGIMTGDWKKIVSGILAVVKGFVSSFIKITLFLINSVIDIQFFLVTGFIKIFGTILSIAIGFATNLANIFMTPLNMIIDAINAISNYFGMGNVFSRISFDSSALEGFVQGFTNSVADLMTIGKDAFMTSIGMGSALPQTYEKVDKAVDYAIGAINVYIAGTVTDSNAKQLGNEAGKSMAETLFNYHNAGVTA